MIVGEDKQQKGVGGRKIRVANEPLYIVVPRGVAPVNLDGWKSLAGAKVTATRTTMLSRSHLLPLLLLECLRSPRRRVAYFANKSSNSVKKTGENTRKRKLLVGGESWLLEIASLHTPLSYFSFLN